MSQTKTLQVTNKCQENKFLFAKCMDVEAVYRELSDLKTKIITELIPKVQ